MRAPTDADDPQIVLCIASKKVPHFVFWYFKGCRSSVEDPAVLMKAYLAEVLSHHEPEEDDRMPTWFAAAEARRRLGQDRDLRARSTLVAAIDRALERFEKTRTHPRPCFPRIRAARVDAPAFN